MDVASGETRADRLRWVKFSGVSWTRDNRGFYYSRYDEPEEGEQFTGANYFQKLYYHRLGDSQDEDQLIYERPDQKEWGFDGTVSEDGRFLIITVWRGTRAQNQVFVQDLNGGGRIVELLTGFDAEYDFIGNRGREFWFATDSGAPNRRVLAIEIDKPQPAHWRELIPETEHVLQGVSHVGGELSGALIEMAMGLLTSPDYNDRWNNYPAGVNTLRLAVDNGNIGFMPGEGTGNYGFETLASYTPAAGDVFELRSRVIRATPSHSPSR